MWYHGVLDRGLAALAAADASTPPPTPPLTDIACAQMGHYTNGLEAELSAVHKHSRRLIERHRALASSMRSN